MTRESSVSWALHLKVPISNFGKGPIKFRNYTSKMEWEYPLIIMNTEILNHTNTQKHTIIISSTDSHTTHHCTWTHPYSIHKRIYLRDYFNIIFYALLLIIYSKVQYSNCLETNSHMLSTLRLLILIAPFNLKSYLIVW